MCYHNMKKLEPLDKTCTNLLSHNKIKNMRYPKNYPMVIHIKIQAEDIVKRCIYGKNKSLQKNTLVIIMAEILLIRRKAQFNQSIL